MSTLCRQPFTMTQPKKIPSARALDFFLRVPVVGKTDVIHQVAYLPRLGLFSFRILDFLDDHDGNAVRFSGWPRPVSAGLLPGATECPGVLWPAEESQNCV